MKLKTKFLATAFSVAMLTLGATASVFAQDTVQDAKINKVDTIALNDAFGTTNTTVWNAGEGTSKEKHRLNIKLDKPGFVKITVSSTVCVKGYNNLGCPNSPMLYTAGGKALGKTSDSLGEIWEGSIYEGCYSLEAGDYYLAYDGKHGDK